MGRSVTALALPAVGSPSGTLSCRHCDGPLGAGRVDFCCAGCAGAYDLIGRLGLRDYYARRHLDAGVERPRPDAAAAADFAACACDIGATEHSLDLALHGLHCAACVWLIENALAAEEDVLAARVNATTCRLTVRWKGPVARANRLAGIVSALGYRVAPWSEGSGDPAARSDERNLLRALGVAGFASMNVMMLSVAIWSGADGGMGEATRSLMHWVSALIALPAVAYAGQPFFRSAWAVLRRGRTNMDVPISIGVSLATALSLYETATGGEHAYFESAVMLLFFLLVGRYLDRRARARARAVVDRFLALRVVGVTVLDGHGATHWRAVRDVLPGDRVLVASGERIGVDGTVESASASIDTSLVTGEATPAAIGSGGAVYAGMINLGAPLILKVSATGDGTLLAEIARLLAVAEQGRSRYIALAERVARLYAPVVHLAALATFAAWYFIFGASAHTAILTAVSVLIITCPCALALAVPAVQVVASAALMRRGILLKSATALERLATVDTVILDKTGTLTLGRPALADERPDPEALRIAAGLAAASRHPLARALADACPDVPVPVDVAEHPGQGIAAMVAGEEIRLGSRLFCGVSGTSGDTDSELWLTRPGHAAVRFRFTDSLRPDAAQTVAALRHARYRVMLLSGDHAGAVAAAAEAAGIVEWQAGVTPAGKVDVVRRLGRDGAHVLMVGDGLNDAAALGAAQASLSPATAADIAQAAADAVFQGTTLRPVATLLAMARASTRLVRQNLVMALVYNLLAVPMAMAGLITPLIAAAAMSGSSVIVILNALRAARSRS